MKFFLMVAALFLGAGLSGCTKGKVVINGAGATFPYPIYSQWAARYNQLTGVKLNYQSIGSGGGIAQIKAGTVDFGASDSPLEEKELGEAGLVQFPMVIGGVVLIINIKGVKSLELKLSQEVFAGIFLGKIRKWNAKEISDLNPGLVLPEENIIVVRRADGSGTTWIFTNYLAKISAEWQNKVGVGKAVNWPVGVGGKGNEGVAAYVQKLSGSIGYVEMAYALQSNIPLARLRNREGAYPKPSIESFQAAASNADWKKAPGFYMVLTDQAGEGSWPITGASYILVHKKQKKAEISKIMFNFFTWCLKNGGDLAKSLGYVPLPEKVTRLVKDLWKISLRSEGRPVVTE